MSFLIFYATKKASGLPTFPPIVSLPFDAFIPYRRAKIDIFGLCFCPTSLASSGRCWLCPGLLVDYGLAASRCGLVRASCGMFTGSR